ncbi:unnamed protein product [Prunus armeniaca]
MGWPLALCFDKEIFEEPIHWPYWIERSGIGDTLEISGKGAIDDERENELRECTGDVVDNELVLLVPLSMGRIGLGKRGGGGCGCFGGFELAEPNEIVGVNKLDKMRRVGAREVDGGFRRSHEVDLKERIGSNKGEGGNPR